MIHVTASSTEMLRAAALAAGRQAIACGGSSAGGGVLAASAAALQLSHSQQWLTPTVAFLPLSKPLQDDLRREVGGV